MEMHMKVCFTVKDWECLCKNIELAEMFIHSPAQTHCGAAIGCTCKDVRLPRCHHVSGITVFTASDQEAVSFKLRAQCFLSHCWVGSQPTPTPRLKL